MEGGGDGEAKRVRVSTGSKTVVRVVLTSLTAVWPLCAARYSAVAPSGTEFMAPFAPTPTSALARSSASTTVNLPWYHAPGPQYA
eukprot:977414-Rhodomonas_salina.1